MMGHVVGNVVYLWSEIEGTEVLLHRNLDNGVTTIVRMTDGSIVTPRIGYSFMTTSGSLFFNGAVDGLTDSALFRADGPYAGLVVDTVSDGSVVQSSPYSYTLVGDVLYFTANVRDMDGAYGFEWYSVDITTNVATFVQDLNVGSASASIKDPVEFEGTLYFSAFVSGGVGRELFRVAADGASIETVTDLCAGTCNSIPTTGGDLTVFDDTLFFIADDGESGPQVHYVKNGVLGSFSALTGGPDDYALRPDETVELDGALYTIAKIGGTAQIAKITAGDTPTMTMFTSLNGELSANPVNTILKVVGSRLFTGCTYIDDSFDTWINTVCLIETDGTVSPAGDGLSNQGISNIQDVVYDATLAIVYFTADYGGVHTVLRTSLIAMTIEPITGPDDSIPAGVDSLLLRPDGVYVTMSLDGGSNAGAVGIIDRSTGELSIPYSEEGEADARDFFEYDGILYHLVTQRNGNLVVVESSSGTTQLTYGDVYLASSIPSVDDPEDVELEHPCLTFSTELYLELDSGSGPEVYRFDTVEDGGSTVISAISQPGDVRLNARSFHDKDQFVFFVADSSVYGAELWVYDRENVNTPAVLVADLFPGTDGSSPSSLLSMEDGIIFKATVPSGDFNIPRVVFLDVPSMGASTIFSSPLGEYGYIDELTKVGDSVFFVAAYAGPNEINLIHVSDNQTVTPLVDLGHCQDLHEWGGILVFRCYTQGAGNERVYTITEDLVVTELDYATDETGYIASLHVAGDSIFIWANAGNAGGLDVELYRLAGTRGVVPSPPATFELVVDANVGSSGRVYGSEEISQLGDGSFMFFAHETTHGTSLYHLANDDSVTRVQTVNVNSQYADGPSHVTETHGRLFCSLEVNDGQSYGMELVELTPTEIVVYDLVSGSGSSHAGEGGILTYVDRIAFRAYSETYDAYRWHRMAVAGEDNGSIVDRGQYNTPHGISDAPAYAPIISQCKAAETLTCETDFTLLA
jgi:ELWxxDGT repeat protein